MIKAIPQVGMSAHIHVRATLTDNVLAGQRRVQPCTDAEYPTERLPSVQLTLYSPCGNVINGGYVRISAEEAVELMGEIKRAIDDCRAGKATL